MLNVHLGPSPLALGLVIPATRAAGFDVAIIGSPNDKSPLRYGRSISGPAGRLVYTTVQWFLGPRVWEDLPDDLIKRIRSDESVIVTCTLRDRIVDRKPFVEQLLRERPQGAETVLLACENAPHPAYGDIARVANETGALVLKTVVNRMCIRCPNDLEGRRRVSAHPLGEWLIERPPRKLLLLTQLETADEVSLVDDIDARHDRKLWMVNGAHQALAAMARRGNYPDLPAAAQETKVVTRLSHLHAAMSDALEKVHPHLTGNLDYAVDHVTAYCEHPDSINRVLGQFRRSKLAGFFRMLDDRLAAPARVCRTHGVSVEPFVAVFDVLEQLIENLDAYQDAADLRARAVTIDVDADAAAVEAYVELLTGWVEPEAVAARARRIETLLAEHRSAIPRR